MPSVRAEQAPLDGGCSSSENWELVGRARALTLGQIALPLCGFRLLGPFLLGLRRVCYVALKRRRDDPSGSTGLSWRSRCPCRGGRGLYGRSLELRATLA